MKITTFIILMGCLQVAAAGHAQNVTLSFKDAPLEKVFSALEKQTKYVFFCESSLLQKAKKVTIDVKNIPFTEALNECLKDQGFDYIFVKNTVLIELKKQSLSVANVTPERDLIDVKGRVTDKDGNPLAGANVKIKGTNIGTVTDNEGRFAIYNVDVNAILEISFIGHESQSVVVRGKSFFTINLNQKLSILDETLVIAYGTTSRRFATANVATIKALDLEKQPVTNPLLALQGRVPGLEILQDNGNPGSGVRFRIQGRTNLLNLTVSDPLVVVDGVPYPTQNLPTFESGMVANGILGGSIGDNIPAGSTLAFLNPTDIESIDVLKDADATAIYGSRAANGAILITTKKGKAGDNKVEVAIEQGWSKVPMKLKLLNTSQYLEMRMEAKHNNHAAISPTDYDINGLWDTTRYTDWQKELIGRTSHFSRFSASMSGGTPRANYRIGGTYNRQTTIFPGDFANTQGSLSTNINGTDRSQRLQLSFSGSFLMDKNKLPGKDFTELIFLAPDAPALYNSDGTLNWAPDANGISSWTNPLSYNENIFDNKSYNLVSNLSASYKILPNLSIRANFGFSQLSSDQFIGSLDASFKPEERPALLRSGTTTHNMIRTWITEPQINYSFQNFLGGKVETLLGATLQEKESEGMSVIAYGQSSDQMLRNLAAATFFNFVSVNSLYRYSGIFSRVSYVGKDRYLLNLSARRDGSSRFGRNNLFSNFWGVGAGWIFSEENFVKRKLPWLNFGKLRGSYGLMGNDQIGDYQFMSLYSSPAYTIGDIPYQGIASLVGGLSNPDLQWEETRKLQLGLEMGVIDNRVVVNLTWFRNRTSNSLGNVNMPIIVGANSIYTNFPALIQNSGWELTLSTENIKTKKFKWSSNLNLTRPRNKLLAFPDLEYSTSANDLVIGQPLGIRKTYSYYGIDPLTGQFLIRDAKGGLTTTPNSATDQTVWLNRNQLLYGGIQNNFEYKGLQLGVFLQYVQQKGFDFLQGSTAMPGVFQTFLPQSNQPEGVMNRWQKPRDQTNYARFATTNSGFTPGDRGFKELPYLRLQNVALSYEFRDQLLKRLKFKSLRIFLHGQNLYTWTNYQGLNPESKSASSIPPLRLITIGGNIGF